MPEGFLFDISYAAAGGAVTGYSGRRIEALPMALLSILLDFLTPKDCSGGDGP